MMPRKLFTGAYRNVNFRVDRRGTADAITYERAYRLSTMELFRLEKLKPRPYLRKNEWFEQMYPKVMPGPYRRRMSPVDIDKWGLLLEQQRLKIHRQQARVLTRKMPWG